METVDTHTYCFPSFRFKSYYVVWKPSIRNALKSIVILFKSYYVVWKLKSATVFFGRNPTRLNRTMQYGNPLREKRRTVVRLFKSYYVVWKPLYPRWTEMYRWCLNRTMQYGNSYIFHNLNFFFLRLNRTMQYGNLCRKCPNNRYISGFKSYYVVWKLHNTHNKKSKHARFKSYYVVWKPYLYFRSPRALYSCLNRTMQYGNLRPISFSSFSF